MIEKLRVRTRKSASKARTKTRTKAATEPRRRTPQTKRRIIPAPASTGAAGKSVIKQKYRECYEDGSCGDALARKLRKHLEAEGGTIDLAKLQQLAERNGVWASRYASLNPGMARMIVANRLRKLVRASSAIDWGWSCNYETAPNPPSCSASRGVSRSLGGRDCLEVAA